MLPKRSNIPSATDSELVAYQMHRNDWYVRQARSELQHRAATGKLNSAGVHRDLMAQFRSAPNSAKRLRALWCLYVTHGLNSLELVEMLNHADPYVRAWVLQFLGNASDFNAFSPPHQTVTSNWEGDLTEQLVSMARRDPSPIVRLYIASLSQRMAFENRWPILTELAAHAEDSEDHNIWRMIWFALEPMVMANPERAMQFATTGKIPRLNEFVARRMIAGNANPTGSNKTTPTKEAQETIASVAPQFQIKGSGEGGVVLHSEFRNRRAVQTHPFNRETPCVLYRTGCPIPENKTTTLKIRVSHHPHGNWQMRVLVEGDLISDQLVSSETVGKDEWLDVSIDLTSYAGQRIDLWIENKANDWHNEWAYWNLVEIVSE